SVRSSVCAYPSSQSPTDSSGPATTAISSCYTRRRGPAMKMNKLLWLLFGVFLLFGVSECSSSKNNNDDDKREVNPSDLGGSILPEVSPTAPTAETQAPLVEETKTEADAVVTLDMDPGSSKKANRGQPSRQYEHMGCFKLFSFERPSAAMLPSEAD
ncbi:unnamed protein product, partial [Scytosiphon promiscuus]